jgi:hypothetical protein
MKLLVLRVFLGCRGGDVVRQLGTAAGMIRSDGYPWDSVDNVRAQYNSNIPYGPFARLSI